MSDARPVGRMADARPVGRTAEAGPVAQHNPAAVAEARPSRAARRSETLRDLLALTKPRIVELLLVTALPTMVVAARGLPTLAAAAAVLIGGSLAAGSANAFNCWYDRDVDALMPRTADRPLARGSLSPGAALVFAVILGAASITLLAVTANLLAAALAAAAIAMYAVGYTVVLKRRTPQAVVWGGSAGCAPVLIAWAVVTGELSWTAWALFAVVFLWTPPHYWPLAMRYRDEYAAAGLPMLPVVASPAVVTDRIVAYAWPMVAVSVLPWWPLQSSGPLYGIAALLLGAAFLVEAHRLRRAVRRDPDAPSLRLFAVSIAYLALLFTALAFDQFV